MQSQEMLLAGDVRPVSDLESENKNAPTFPEESAKASEDSKDVESGPAKAEAAEESAAPEPTATPKQPEAFARPVTPALKSTADALSVSDDSKNGGSLHCCSLQDAVQMIGRPLDGFMPFAACEMQELFPI